MKLRVKKLVAHAALPRRAAPREAGYDLTAAWDAYLPPGAVTAVRTGIALELPPGHAGLIWGRSGKARQGLYSVGGVIDETYRGELTVLLHNANAHELTIEAGMRVAQLLVQPVASFEVEEADELSATERGGLGFGSTGA